MRIQEDDFTALIKNGESVCLFVCSSIHFLPQHEASEVRVHESLFSDVLKDEMSNL